MWCACMTTLRGMHAGSKMRSNQSILMSPKSLYTSPSFTTMSYHGVASTEEEPHLIKEHVFVISDDSIQDQDSVHKVQELIYNYLINDVHYNVIKMHEFTDGCAAQYKSRHCIGDLSCSLADFGFHIQRNYFETSHAKGEQDAAGSHVKQKVSQAVLHRTATINSA